MRSQPGFLDSRIRRFQSFAEISTEPGPHFGLGLEAYATWTSPIRKFGDMVNHRLLKAIMRGETIARPQDDMTLIMTERRRLNRMAERDVGDWLYARFLAPFAGTDRKFSAEIIDVSAAAACACAWWITVRSPLSLPRSFTPFVTNWSARRKAAPCRSKVKWPTE